MSAPVITAACHWPSAHRPSAYRYRTGCRHPDCRTAANQAAADGKAGAARRARRDPSLVPHGTPAGYGYWGCRCVRCGEAQRLERAWFRAVARQRDGLPLTAYSLKILAGGKP